MQATKRSARPFMFSRSRESAFGCRDGLADDTKGHLRNSTVPFSAAATVVRPVLLLIACGLSHEPNCPISGSSCAPSWPSDREGVRFGQGFTKHAICQKCRP